ncbi:MAG TPA: O-antigen ligase family protein [Verrucomicrobiota bacterium]|nr:MAG: O-Antigen ligase [Candidatus Hydrogenedentes bacterium ADurb.Bin179]HPY31737.1 O-antigen ligase family protein [Verrucomicrobiota bacterium]HQB18007.1 O-antigen ligase family protein [Verrucomicrobiota bacterium]
MPPQLALLLCIGLIIWLFRVDMKLRRLSSHALWIPGIWLAIIGSRPLGYWLGLDVGAAGTAVEGNPINLVVQGGLMLAAGVILQRRNFDWGEFFRDNKALVALYAYFVLSALWSFYPFPTVKHIVRDFGTVLMVLVILTEPDPFATARVLFTRIAYILFPLSVVFIKYFPEYGRMYSRGWELMYTGVTTHKNSLGAIVLVFGWMLALDLLELRHTETDSSDRKRTLRIRYGLLLAGLWLLFMSNSKTALVCMVLGGVAFWGSRHLVKLRHPGRMAVACLIVITLVGVTEYFFDVSSLVIHSLDREENLTGRTAIWDMVKEQPINPIVGYGFMSFWDGPAGQAYREKSGTMLNSAHNGYLETYVDGGGIGLALLITLLLAAAARIFGNLSSGALAVRTSFLFLVVTVVYNWSESNYFRLGVLWFMFLLATVSGAAGVWKPATQTTPVDSKNIADEMPNLA